MIQYKVLLGTMATTFFADALVDAAVATNGPIRLVLPITDEDIICSTLMSHLGAEHSHSRGILGFMTTLEANSLRLISREFRDEVSRFRWNDSKTFVIGSLEKWRTTFPKAETINLSHRHDICDDDLKHIKGCRNVNISWCVNITSAGFEHLSKVRNLLMNGCDQLTLTDDAFKYLKEIRTLEMSHCKQITDAGLAHLKGIQMLDMKFTTSTFKKQIWKMYFLN